MVRRFSACGPPSTPNHKGSSERVDDSGDRLIAFCWWPDSSKLVVATAGGSLYILERYGGLNAEGGRLGQSLTQPHYYLPCRSCKVICAYFAEKQPFPWSTPAAGCVAAMAMPSEDRLLLLTSQTQLFSVPFASAVASASTFVSIKPVNLRVGGDQR